MYCKIIILILKYIVFYIILFAQFITSSNKLSITELKSEKTYPKENPGISYSSENPEIISGNDKRLYREIQTDETDIYKRSCSSINFVGF